MPTPAKHFDRAYYHSGNYDAYEDDVRSWVAPVARKIVRLTSTLKHPKILDAGCAHGFLLEELQDKYGFAVAGIEYSQHAARTAQPTVKKYIKNGSILQKTLFSKGAFDVVTCFDVVEYLSEEETEKALANLARWSRRYILFSALYRHSLQSSQKRNPDPLRRTTLSQKEYVDIFRKNNAGLLEKRNLGNGGDILIFQKRT